MFLGSIHRMILGELLKVFFLALIALTGLILIAGVISEAMKNGFGPAQIVVIVPMLLPSLLPYTVPTTTLFATCIVYGRLSADNEILALKAAGVHIAHVVWPALFLGAATCAVTMFCFLDIIPQTGYLLRNQVISDVEELLYQMLRKDGYIRHPSIKLEIHVGSMNGRKLQDVVFKRKGADGTFDVIAVAKEAELRVSMAEMLILVDMRQCQVTQGATTAGVVDRKEWGVELPADFLGNKNKVRAMDMTWRELSEYLDKKRDDRVRIVLEMDMLQARTNLGSGQPEDVMTFRRLTEDLRLCDQMIHAILADFNMRPALALGCLCFALVGCPVGIWFSKSDFLSAFITCFLPIVVLYYPAMLCLFDLSRAGKIPPYLAVYNADALTLLTGWLLFHRLARH